MDVYLSFIRTLSSDVKNIGVAPKQKWWYGIWLSWKFGGEQDNIAFYLY